MGETEKKQNPYLWSMRVLYAVAFLVLFDLTIIVPTSAKYFLAMLHGKNEEEDKSQANFYFSLSLSMFSAAQAFVGIFGGYIIYFLGFKKTFIVLILCTIIGDSMYSLSISPAVSVIGRAIAGIGSANLGMVFTYIAVTTTTEERQHYMTVARLFSTIGLIFSPGFVFILGFIDFRIGHYHCDQYNASGWATDIISIAIIIAVIFVLKDVSQSTVDLSHVDTTNSGTSTPSNTPKARPKSLLSKPYISPEVFVIFFLAMYNGYVGTSFEFMTAPITTEKFNMSASHLSLYMLGGSAVIVAMILCIMKLGPKWKFAAQYGERFWMMMAFSWSVVGVTLCYLGSQQRFHMGIVLEKATFMVGQTLCLSAYMLLSISLMPLSSKIVPPESKEMMLPWVNSCLAIGRLAGPLWTTYAFSAQHLKNTEMIFGTMMGVVIFCIALCSIYWKYLVLDAWKLHPSKRTLEDGANEKTPLIAGAVNN